MRLVAEVSELTYIAEEMTALDTAVKSGATCSENYVGDHNKTRAFSVFVHLKIIG